jgi:hypothetical protein
VPIVRRSGALTACVPSGRVEMGLAAALAAPEAFAGVGDGKGFGQSVDVDVCGAAAVRA